ncbi:MAG: ABC transporter permease [Phycisphaerae bacterium]
MVTDAGTWRVLLRSPSAMVGAAFIAGLVLAAVFADAIAPYGPLAQARGADAGGHPRTPSADHWLGTDALGRDVLSRVLHGGRRSLPIGMISVGIGFLVGVPVGSLAGMRGGWVDASLMRVVDVTMAVPSILLAIAIVGALGPSLTHVMVAVGVVQAPIFARQIRASVLSIRSLDYVTASRALGASGARILLRDVWPNCVGPMLVLATLGMGGAILDVAGMSFLGLGGQPDEPEWGTMLNAAREFVHDRPWVIIAPGAAITLTVLGFNLLGDALRDVLDPKTVR